MPENEDLEIKELQQLILATCKGANNQEAIIDCIARHYVKIYADIHAGLGIASTFEAELQPKVEQLIESSQRENHLLAFQYIHRFMPEIQVALWRKWIPMLPQTKKYLGHIQTYARRHQSAKKDKAEYEAKEIERWKTTRKIRKWRKIRWLLYFYPPLNKKYKQWQKKLQQLGGYSHYIWHSQASVLIEEWASEGRLQHMIHHLSYEIPFIDFEQDK